MTYSAVLTRLYFLLTCTDGDVNEKEKQVARHMIKAEGISEGEFTSQMGLLKAVDKKLLYNESLAGLKKLTQKQQVRIIAWLCVVANADGFMDRAEWQLIYRVYHKELALSLHDIFSVQKDLTRLTWENTFLTIL